MLYGWLLSSMHARFADDRIAKSVQISASLARDRVRRIRVCAGRTYEGTPASAEDNDNMLTSAYVRDVKRVTLFSIHDDSNIYCSICLRATCRNKI